MAAAAAICATAMSSGRHDGEDFEAGRNRPTRRTLIAAALGAAVPAQAGDVPAKVSQNAAAYQATPKGMFSCAACTFFIAPRN